MPGQLFTHYFLTDGIRETPEWKASAADPEAFASFREGVARRYEALRRSSDPNEAVTEQDLIRPALDLLGSEDLGGEIRISGDPIVGFDESGRRGQALAIRVQ